MPSASPSPEINLARALVGRNAQEPTTRFEMTITEFNPENKRIKANVDEPGRSGDYKEGETVSFKFISQTGSEFHWKQASAADPQLLTYNSETRVLTLKLGAVDFR